MILFLVILAAVCWLDERPVGRILLWGGATALFWWAFLR